MTYTKDSIVFQPLSTDPRFLNLTNRTFERLFVMGYLGKQKNRQKWACLCSCGKFHESSTDNLMSGNTKSCGCFRKDNSPRVTHGMARTPEAKAFYKAKGRCTNPRDRQFADYGGRGIEFRFDSFEDFYAEIGPKPTSQHSIDRKDNEGHYERGNIHWATDEEQAKNRRTTHLITVDGLTMCVKDWAKHKNLNVGTLHSRLQINWCEDCAINLPVGGRCYHRPLCNSSKLI